MYTVNCSTRWLVKIGTQCNLEFCVLVADLGQDNFDSSSVLASIVEAHEVRNLTSDFWV
jgi:hypothetical protein